MPVTSVGLINGKQPGSTWEWWVAVGLWHLGWSFDYQVWFLGGRILKGGQVIDFLVHTLPFSTPLYVQGDHWHGGPKEDHDKYLMATLFAVMGGSLRQPVTLEGWQLVDQETTINSLKALFGRGPNPSIPIPAPLLETDARKTRARR